MMLVMPIIPQTASLLPAGAPVAEKVAPGFAETLRSESNALSRTASREAGQEAHDLREERQEAHATRAERESSLRTAGREKGERELADKPAGPEPLVKEAGTAGENKVVTDEGAAVATNNLASTDDLSVQVPVAPSQPLPAWLLAPPVATMASLGAEGAVVASNPGQALVLEATGVAATLVQPGFAGNSALVGESVEPLSPQVTEARLTPPPIELLTSVGPEAEAGLSQLASAAVAGETPLVSAQVATRGETGNPGNLRAFSEQNSNPPVGLISEAVAALVPEITLTAVPATSLAPSVIDQELTAQAAALAILGQGLNPEPASQKTSPVELSPVTTPVVVTPKVIPVAVTQQTMPQELKPAANPETTAQKMVLADLPRATAPEAAGQSVTPLAASQAVTPAVMASTLPAERPVPASGENSLRLDASRPGDHGQPVTIVAPMVSAESQGDLRGFGNFTGSAADELEKVARLVDSGRAEFAALLTGADSVGSMAILRTAAQTPATPAVTSTLALDGRIVDQVVSRVNLSSAKGETTLAMTLHPRELGEIRVELIAGKDGMRAHLHSQTQMVQEVLERHLPRLREAFEAQGVKLSDLQVSCDSRRDGGNAAFQQREQGQAAPYRQQIVESLAGTAQPLEWSGGVTASVSGWSSSPGFSLRV